MLRRVELPPELFTETFRLATDALQIVEVLGRYFLKHRAEVGHRHRCESVLLTGVIQMAEEEAHELAALSLALFSLGRRRRSFLYVGKNVAYGFHAASMEAPSFLRRFTMSS